MTDSIYEAPQAELEVAKPLHEFYVVSIQKFMVLFLVTVSLYSVYWFYKNWSLYKSYNQVKLLAPLRAIFSILFTHSLFGRVHEALKNKSIAHAWSPAWIATLYVIASVVSQVFDQLSAKSVGSPYTDIISIFMLFLTCYPLVVAQRAINVSQEDASGESNKNFTPANIIWCILGGLLWLLIGVGLLDTLNVVDIESGTY